MVEWVFRTSKSKIRYGGTMDLEMRPVHVRLASRARGHALVIILSYKIMPVTEEGDWWAEAVRPQALSLVVGVCTHTPSSSLRASGHTALHPPLITGGTER